MKKLFLVFFFFSLVIGIQSSYGKANHEEFPCPKGTKPVISFDPDGRGANINCVDIVNND